jgi:membrane associated rhomboid family serine protease
MKLPPARATVALLVVTVAAFVVASASGREDWAVLYVGFVPARIGGVLLPGAVPLWLTPLSASLVHAGLIHLGFNMLMLGYCGRYVELALRPAGLVALYLGGAYAAAAAHYLSEPMSPVPMVGASGAVSALVGAYALLYGQQKAGPGRMGRLLNILWLAAAWTGVQLLVGLASAGEGRSIAIAAHIGGFIAGLLLARPLLVLRWRGA